METAKIKELVSKMTLEEKASLCSGLDFWHTKGVERLGIPSEMVSDGPHGLRKQDDKADHLGINDSIQAVCFPAGCATDLQNTSLKSIHTVISYAVSFSKNKSNNRVSIITKSKLGHSKADTISAVYI